MSQENVQLVRSIYEPWGRGDFRSVEWAHPEIEFVMADLGPASGAWKGVPEDAFMASGHMGQFTMIVPSRDLVVVRLGPSPRGSEAYMSELVSKILSGIGG